MNPDTHPHHPHSSGSHPSEEARPLTIRRLKWIAFAASLGFVVVLETARQALFPYLTGWGGNLLLDGFVFIATLFFLGGVFDVIERIHLQLERKNRELSALRQAGLLVFSELSEEVVLQKVVDQARQLIATKYGALSVLAEGGGILAFVTSGIDPEERSRIGLPPVGRGVLGVTLHHGHAMRVSELSGHPESVGFPANHPPMKSLLAVPIPCKMPFRGNLYLCDKVDGSPFDGNDEATLGHFAVSAAIAIDNAELHRRAGELAASEERLRLAHEMHDGLAQVLAYVNTKAQAVQGYLRSGKLEEADSQLDQLAAAAGRSTRMSARASSACGSRPIPTSISAPPSRPSSRSGRPRPESTPLRGRGGADPPPGAELQLLRAVPGGASPCPASASRANLVSVACGRSCRSASSWSCTWRRRLRPDDSAARRSRVSGCSPSATAPRASAPGRAPTAPGQGTPVDVSFPASR